MHWHELSPFLLAQQQAGGFTCRHPLNDLFPFFFPHRPLKVERGRKKSDLIPERRMEKKKGEREVTEGREGSQGWFLPQLELGQGSLQLGSVWLCLHLSSTAVVPASHWKVFTRRVETTFLHKFLPLLAHPSPSSS